MTPEVERFLELATRPLEGRPEARDEAKSELMARVGHGGVPLEMLDLGAPTACLEKAGLRKPWARRAALAAGLFAVSAGTVAALAWQAREITMTEQATTLVHLARHASNHGDKMERPWLVMDHVRRVAPELPIGLGGFHRESTAAWLARRPDDLAMLQEQVLRRTRDENVRWTGLSETEQEMVTRLDPDNAVWSLMQVKPRLAQATDSSKRYYYSRRGSRHVKNEAEFEKALRHFSEAAARPEFRDHSLALARRQIEAFPRGRTIAGDEITASIARLVTPLDENYGYGLSDVVSIQCERLQAAGDRGGLVKLMDEWQRLTRAMIRATGRGEADLAKASHQFLAMGRSLHSAFGSLGMTEEESEIMRQMTLLQSRPHPPPNIQEAAGLRTQHRYQIPKDLTVAELIPSRKTEFAFFDRTLAGCGAVLGLVFTGLVLLESSRRSRPTKGLARGLIPLFTRRDHLWIGAIGLGVPWLWWWGITRLTPLGMRDTKLNEWNALVWLVQPTAAFVLALVLLLRTAQWRWHKAAGSLGLGPSLGWLGWLAALLTALALPAAGVLRYLKLNNEDSAFFLAGISGVAACGLLWLLWEGGMNLFTPKAGALRPNVTMRVLRPWCLAGVTTLLVAAVVSLAMEHYWFARDPLLPTWTSETHRNALEERTARDFHEQVRDF